MTRGGRGQRGGIGSAVRSQAETVPQSVGSRAATMSGRWRWRQPQWMVAAARDNSVTSTLCGSSGSAGSGFASLRAASRNWLGETPMMRVSAQRRTFGIEPAVMRATSGSGRGRGQRARQAA